MIVIDNQQDLDKFFNDFTFSNPDVNIIKDVKFLFRKDNKDDKENIGYITKKHFINMLEVLMFENCTFENIIFEKINNIGKLLFKNCDINASFYFCNFMDILGFSNCNINTQNKFYSKILNNEKYELKFINNDIGFLLLNNCTYNNNSLYIEGGNIENFKIIGEDYVKEDPRRYFIFNNSNLTEVKIGNLILENEELYKPIRAYLIKYIDSVIIEGPGGLYKNYKIYKFKIPFLDTVNQYSKIKDFWTFDFWKDEDTNIVNSYDKKISKYINIIYDELLNKVEITRDLSGISYYLDLEDLGRMLYIKNPISINELRLKLSNGCSIQDLEDVIISKNKDFHDLLTFCILKPSDSEYILWNKDEEYRELKEKKSAAFLEYNKFKNYIIEREKEKRKKEGYDSDNNYNSYYSWDETDGEHGLYNQLAIDYNLTEEELEKYILLVETYNVAKKEYADYYNNNKFEAKYRYCYIDYIRPKLLLVYEYINRIKRH